MQCVKADRQYVNSIPILYGLIRIKCGKYRIVISNWFLLKNACIYINIRTQ